MMERTIQITNSDLARLEKLLEGGRRSSQRDLAHLESLRVELERAEIVEDSEVPSDVITMHSRILVQDLTTGGNIIYTLVYPNEADLSLNKVSVLAPIGTAFLGYRTGDIIAWNMPGGTRRFLVKDVLFQPEASRKTVASAPRDVSRPSTESQDFIDRAGVWPPGTHVRLLKEDHRRSGEFGKVVAALRNPSGQPSSQWYDIRFGDGHFGRFPAKYLEAISMVPADETLALAA
jgi:regulator of nucleoside diphosphate kinase